MHGYLSSGMAFNRQIAFFNRYYDVYAPDLKGFGDNSYMEYPYSLDDYIEDVKEYMYKNSIISPNVIAHSFGGRIALKGVYKSPELFNKIVLTGCAGLKPKTTFKKAVKKMAFNILKPLIKKENLQKFYSADYRALNPVMQKSFIKIINEKLDYTLPFIKNDTLIIFGKDDTETPLYMAKRLNNNIKNSKLIILKNAGHFCFLDRPITFNLEVKEFFLS